MRVWRKQGQEMPGKHSQPQTPGAGRGNGFPGASEKGSVRKGPWQQLQWPRVPSPSEMWERATVMPRASSLHFLPERPTEQPRLRRATRVQEAARRRTPCGAEGGGGSGVHRENTGCTGSSCVLRCPSCGASSRSQPGHTFSRDCPRSPRGVRLSCGCGTHAAPPLRQLEGTAKFSYLKHVLQGLSSNGEVPSLSLCGCKKPRHHPPNAPVPYPPFLTGHHIWRELYLNNNF